MTSSKIPRGASPNTDPQPRQTSARNPTRILNQSEREKRKSGKSQASRFLPRLQTTMPTKNAMKAAPNQTAGISTAGRIERNQRLRQSPDNLPNLLAKRAKNQTAPRSQQKQEGETRTTTQSPHRTRSVRQLLVKPPQIALSRCPLGNFVLGKHSPVFSRANHPK